MKKVLLVIISICLLVLTACSTTPKDNKTLQAPKDDESTQKPNLIQKELDHAIELTDLNLEGMPPEDLAVEMTDNNNILFSYVTVDGKNNCMNYYAYNLQTKFGNKVGSFDNYNSNSFKKAVMNDGKVYFEPGVFKTENSIENHLICIDTKNNTVRNIEEVDLKEYDKSPIVPVERLNDEEIIVFEFPDEKNQALLKYNTKTSKVERFILENIGVQDICADNGKVFVYGYRGEQGIVQVYKSDFTLEKEIDVTDVLKPRAMHDTIYNFKVYNNYMAFETLNKKCLLVDTSKPVPEFVDIQSLGGARTIVGGRDGYPDKSCPNVFFIMLKTTIPAIGVFNIENNRYTKMPVKLEDGYKLTQVVGDSKGNLILQSRGGQNNTFVKWYTLSAEQIEREVNSVQ